MDEALETALRFLAHRPRSEQEVRRRLAQVDPPVVDAVVQRLQAVGLIDDAAFAQYWLEQRRSFRPRGARMLRAELRRHGIADVLASAAAGAAAASADQDAYRAAARRARQLAHLDERTFRTRLGQFLARRGFDWDTIAAVVDRLWQERVEEVEKSRSRQPRLA
jgi:regulatory protein